MIRLCSIVFTVSLSVAHVVAAATPPATLASLEAAARVSSTRQARSTLTPATDAVFTNIESFEPPGSARVPNYLRALGAKPTTVRPFSVLIRTFTYGGHLSPALKLAMATRIAQVNRTPYGAAHLIRLLRNTGAHGEQLLGALRTGSLDSLPPPDRLALRWAELQTQDIHGMSDEEFGQLRRFYSDSDIVELTFTVCFFNYFTRMVEGLGLPVEPWVLDTRAKPAPAPAWSRDRLPARVALISDEEIETTGAALQSARRPATAGAGLGIGMANSQRAMMRVPDLAAAWREFGAANGSSTVGREILLQVSFAVSMANGCRYCTIHQVVGLRRLGVDPTKLLAMEKDDQALTPRETTAVVFARKLTVAPAGVTDADYATLVREFGAMGALEVLLQTCNFSFMNRFTDGLHLPSEDEAIRIYREVYGREDPPPSTRR
ncbi:MAG: hypothetical protein ABMA15_20040 [Vicinamibacterales bacterium]